MDSVDDANDGVVDGNERLAEGHRSFAAAFVVDEFAGAGLVRGIGADDRIAFSLARFREWLDYEHRHPLEAFVHLTGDQRTDDFAEEHVSFPTATRLNIKAQGRSPRRPHPGIVSI